MSEFEELINSLPINITRTIQEHCSCGRLHDKILRYDLEIRLDRTYYLHKIIPQYYIYYKCSDIPIGNSNRYIGVNNGYGKATIKEAVEELKTYLSAEELEENK